MCQQTVLRAHILLGQTFYYSLYLKLMDQWYESGSVPMSAVYGTR